MNHVIRMPCIFLWVEKLVENIIFGLVTEDSCEISNILKNIKRELFFYYYLVSKYYLDDNLRIVIKKINKIIKYFFLKLMIIL
jgi:hypothetical protein